MEYLIEALAHSYLSMALWLFGLMLLFGALEHIAPCNPDQPKLRCGIATDLLYYFLLPLLNRLARMLLVALGIYIVLHDAGPQSLLSFMTSGYGPLSRLPVWLQAALAFILADLLLYAIHRGFHGRALWPFHAIHHSSPHVDWLSTYRFHPVNTWLAFTFVDVLMLFIGFSPEAITAMVTFNTLYSAMVHANLDWTFGPFRYVFASPVFHRWHHTMQAEGMNKNFAPTFPLIDIICGTFYMPEGEKPQRYGIDGDAIPHGFFRQLLWPFRRRN